MAIDRIGAVICTALLCSGIAGCGSLPQIGTQELYCCKPEAKRAYTYRIEFEDMPEFLKPMLRDEASIVLDTKNLEYTEEENAHAVLLMSYGDRVQTEPQKEPADNWEPISPGGPVRFVAAVQMELTNRLTGERIWAGVMRRTHNVYDGSYMHEAPARTAMRIAFTDLFSGLPDSIEEDF